MDDPVAVVLEVDALACRVGREQDADKRLLRVGLERRLDRRSLVSVHSSEQQLSAASFCQPLCREEVEQPLLRVAVLGEHDHPLVVPDSTRPARLLDQVEQRQRLRIRT